MRVLQDGAVLAWLSDVERQEGRLTAVWHGPPPRFGPSEQLEPFVLESDDGLEREEGWLCRMWEVPPGEAHVEIGSERDAPPWRRAESASHPSEGGEPAAVRAAARAARVLVVDDDPDTLDVIADSLAAEGWQPTKASSGREALDLASMEPPDVAIIDLIMPEISGGEVCSAMRRMPALAATRILVLSAAEDTRIVAAECDADGAITKPFTVALLVREVRRLLGP